MRQVLITLPIVHCLNLASNDKSFKLVLFSSKINLSLYKHTSLNVIYYKMDKKTQNLIERIYNSQFSVNYKFTGSFGNRYLTYADYIASGQPLKLIEEHIRKVILPTYANTHTETSFTGLQTSKYREEAREIIKSSVNANEDDILIFTGSGSTGAIDLLIRKLIQFYSSKESFPVVFIGPYEHHSNVLPWREGPFELVELPIGSNGNIDLVELEKQLIKYHKIRPLIGSFSAASNVTGILAPVEEIHALLKKYDALSFWDYAGAAPYVEIDMNPKNIVGKDAIFISPHKLIGGPGSPGILLVKKYLFSEGLPVVTGGGTVHFVTKTQQRYFEDLEIREEGGTPAIIEAIRAGMSFRLKDMVGATNIEEIERKYILEAIDTFSKHPNIFVLGNLEAPRLGFMAFHVKHQNRFLHHNFVVALLNDLFGIQSRGGCSCAGPYGHDLLNLDEEKSQKYMVELATGNAGSKPGWVRLNFNYFIPKDEFDFILKCMIWISENGWKLLNSYHFDDHEGMWHVKDKKNVPTNTIYNFVTEAPKMNKGSSIGKKIMRKQYLKKANKIAEKALSSFHSKSFQDYKYNQIENPLRWYSLANDIET